VKDKLLSNLF